MAVILDQITIGDQRIVVLDSAPNTGGGFSGNVGDLAIVTGTTGIYQKGNTGDTDWALSSVDPEQVMDIVGAALTDTSTIDFTYDDNAGTLIAALKALSVADSHIATNAAIALSKLASVTASRVLVSDGSGVISASSVTTTTLGYLDATSSIQTQINGKISSSEKGANNGVATLDAGGKVPVSQLPNAVMELQGFFDPNATSLADGVGNPGDVYEASAAGTKNFGNGAITFNIGDWAVYAADGKYHKSVNSNEVASVNGQTGIVVLTTDNISEGTTNLYFTSARAKTAAVADSITNGVLDVAPSQNAVFDALALKANASDLTNHLNDTIDAHDASAISFVDTTIGNVNGQTDVQAALVTAIDYVSQHTIQDSGAVAMAADLNLGSNKIINVGTPTLGTDAANKTYVDGKVVDGITDGVTTSAPSQNAVFDALALKQSTSEKGVANGYASLDATGKVPASQLPAYVDDVVEYSNLASFPVTGVAGIIYVALDTNRTYRWSGSAYIEISASDVSSVNGHTGAVTLVSADLADFVESAQDAVAGALVDSATIDFTYTDASNQITAAVIQSGISHANISGLSSDDHSQYALLAGRAGGQTIKGDTASAGNLTINSTANATKGKIIFGAAAAVDEANSRLGVGTVSPESVIDVVENNVRLGFRGTSTSTTGAVNAVISSITPASNSVELVKISVIGIDDIFSSVAYERTVKVKNVGGTVSLGTIQSDYTVEDAGLAAANCTFIVNGNAVDVRVTGVNAKTITWKCVLQRIR